MSGVRSITPPGPGLALDCAICVALRVATDCGISNNAHIITMGARVLGVELAKDIADAFLASSFDPEGESADNVQAIDAVDAKYHTTV
ncbi:RpiB/LacA/LacB family sugar-phosphate isomerase [Thioclava sp. F34-6]|uniref:RpiB/LacA/LacB family sugar-phosphate isomerase n=1 Tax=Thioclava sp. F34-6 TaxID=1973003 RepID=UPI001F0AB0D2|nr:RpiB/LacA/LacB family sugar-phosphate isomerase [Thioclava sp. F34-6]